MGTSSIGRIISIDTYKIIAELCLIEMEHKEVLKMKQINTGIKNLRALIVPMAAMAETSGPSSRCRLLAEGFRNVGIKTAVCMAKDPNYKEISDIPNYYLDVPMPFGLPEFIASRTFPVAQKLGIVSKKAVNSFDQVLYFTGNLDYRYLTKSVASIRKAIREYKPDFIYSEFNISAIIAAKKENLPLYATVSYPTQHEFSHKTSLAKGLNKLLSDLHLPKVDSALKLFDWPEQKFCPSIRELESIEKPDVYYCGSFKSVKKMDFNRDKIVVYMGNGTVSASKMLKVICKAFSNSSYEVFIASSYLKEKTNDNIHIAHRWDFNTLLDESVLFINHGGQNSIVDGLLHGVPQIVVPGKVFERKFNAKCITDTQSGVTVEYKDFDEEHIRAAANTVINSAIMVKNAEQLGRKLSECGGINVIINRIFCCLSP